MQVKGSKFIVTGGSSGLGAATVRMLAANGASVTIADVNEDGGNALASELGVNFVKCDVSNEESVEVAVDFAVGEMQGLNGLVNCAGIAIASKVLSSRGDHSMDAFSRVIGINLIGSFNMIKTAGAFMNGQEPNEAGERGVIINTASVAAYDGQIGQAAYAASKGGIVGMTLPIAREYARYGIRVMTIAPGLFLTPMMSGLPEAAQQSLATQVPFPSRLGRPDEYAQLAQHIIENEMLNGETIRLDGAIRLAPR